MSAGYYLAGKVGGIATFELAIRRLPANRDWVIAAGIERAVEYLTGLSFEEAEIEYLRGLPNLKNAPAGFFEALRDFRFTGDVDAVSEGTALLAGEPLLSLRAPLMEGQIPETYLLSAITFETLIATKAARIVDAAAGRPVLEFGTRRAHTPEAGTIGARAAYIGGCAGTSNTLTGFRYGIPVFGTSAHSWVMSFPSEIEAFRELQTLLGEYTVQLIDTYDAVEGARRAAAVGNPLWGVRIDSGDLLGLSRKVRLILDQAGLPHVRIMASGDLEEKRIAELVASGAPIDAFGVGTELATSGDAPSMGMTYKLVELDENGGRRYTAKRSADKSSLPAAKQVWRFADRDVVSTAEERFEGAAPLLLPLIRNGTPVKPPGTLDEARLRAAESRRALRPDHRVEYSETLARIIESVRRS